MVDTAEGLRLTAVDLGDRKRLAGHWWWLSIEALQPITHSSLRVSVIPKDIQQCC